MWTDGSIHPLFPVTHHPRQIFNNTINWNWKKSLTPDQNAIAATIMDDIQVAASSLQVCAGNFLWM